MPPLLGHKLGHRHELPRLVHQFNGQLAVAAGHEQPPGDDAGEDGHVDIPPGEEANGFLAFQVQLVEHGGGHGNRSCPLGDQFMLLHQGQDGGGNLVVADRHHVVHVVGAKFIGEGARLLDGDAVGDGEDGVQAFDVGVVEGVEHGGGAGGLDSVDLDFGIQVLQGEGDA